MDPLNEAALETDALISSQQQLARRPKSESLSRDDRIRVQTLHDYGLTNLQISRQLGCTLRQVQYAVNHRLTPQHRGKKGPAYMITTPSKRMLEAWIRASPRNRYVPWAEITLILGQNCSECAIGRALRSMGY